MYYYYMFAVTPESMGKIDRDATKKYKIPSIVLMENAGLSAVNYIFEHYKFTSALILAGHGNNGGDGFVIARHMFNRNAHVEVLTVSDTAKCTKDAKTNLDILTKLNIPIKTPHSSMPALIKHMDKFDIVIDCIFGTGFRGEIRDPYTHIFKAITKISKPVISIDIPSGIDGLTGKPAKLSVNADSTITFACIKTGMLWPEAMQRCGDLYTADISIPQDLVHDHNPKAVIDRDTAHYLFNRKQTDKWVHKTAKGKLGIIGGARGMQGAPQMSGISALKAGAGIVYVHLMTDTSRKLYPELVFENSPLKISQMENLVIGPGMGTDSSAKELLLSILKHDKNKNILLDADALNILSSVPLKIRKELLQGCIITPHPEEFRRISGMEFNSMDSKISAAEKFAKDTGSLLVLKSPPTIITDGHSTFILPYMSEKLATAGSGDVLAGIIGGLISTGLDPVSSAAAGVFAHFSAGYSAKGKSISAQNIIDMIPEAIGKI